MSSFMRNGTPFEVHKLSGIDVHVKREDLCNLVDNCPPYSKMRGLELFLKKQQPGTPIGVQDAGYHSRSGWGTAFFCSQMDMPCYVGYPVYKAEGDLENHTLREFQRNAKDLGANLIPVKAGRATVAYYQARNIFDAETNGKGIMLPAGLKLAESVIGTSNEVYDYTPDKLCSGTWIVAISSGTVAAGVLHGMKTWQQDICFVNYFGSSKNEEKTRKYMIDIAGYEPDDMIYIDDGWKYKEEAEPVTAFPASVFYEAKAWWWLEENIHDFEEPIVFWNIGT